MWSVALRACIHRHTNTHAHAHAHTYKYTSEHAWFGVKDTYFVFHSDTHTHISPQIWTGAEAHLPACLCGVLTLLFVSSCTVRQVAAASSWTGRQPISACCFASSCEVRLAVSCCKEPSRARGGGSAAGRIPWRCRRGWRGTLRAWCGAVCV